MEKSVNEFANKFLNGDFENVDVKTQIEAGWYDWFCRDSSLAYKTESLGKKVLQLMKSDKIDNENMYVWFKNNCPMNSSLYDDLRFADRKTGEVMYTVTPRYSHSGKAEVWGRENDFQEALVEGTWKDVKAFFGV